MSLFRNILILYLCLAFVMSIGGFPTPFNSFISSGGNFQDLMDALISSFGFNAGNFTIALVGLAAVIAAIVAGGGFAFPILIAIIAASMIVPLFTIPLTLGNVGMPPEVNAVYTAFVVVLQFLFTLGLVDWMRGEMN